MVTVGSEVPHLCLYRASKLENPYTFKILKKNYSILPSGAFSLGKSVYGQGLGTQDKHANLHLMGLEMSDGRRFNMPLIQLYRKIRHEAYSVQGTVGLMMDEI